MSEEEIRLDQTKKVFNTIATLIKNGSCTYRYLIYDLLGFDCSAYAELISGLAITNAICDYEECKQKISTAIEYIKLPRFNGKSKELVDDLINILTILGGKE